MTTTQLPSPHLRGVIDHVEPASLQWLCEYRGLRPTDSLHLSMSDDGKQYRAEVRTSAASWPSIAARNNWMYRIPGVTWDAGHFVLKAPATDVTALIMLAVWGISHITFDDEVTEMSFRVHITRFAMQRQLVEVQARFKSVKSLPADSPLGCDELPLAPYQRAAAYCAVRSEGYALLMEQGTGKTPVAIARADALSEKQGRTIVLVVCPKAVMTNWQVEIDRFSTKNVETFQLRGGDIERRKIFMDAIVASTTHDWVAVMVSYETMVNSVSWLKAVMWNLIVVDESHYIKSSQTKRWKALKILREFSERRVIMTGTPIVNNVADLWTQLEFLGEGWSGFPSFEAFRKFYGQWISTGTGYEVFTGLQNVPLLQERLARVSFSTRKKEAMPDLPDKTYDVIDVEMTAEQEKVYSVLASSLYAEIESELASDSKNPSVTVNNVLVKLLRLAQITSGFVKLDGDIDGDGEWVDGDVNRFDPNPKFEELVRIIKDTPSTSKIIVWACFVQDVRSIAARLKLEGVGHVTYYGGTKDADRQEAVRLFNNDRDTQVFVGNPAAGGTGLNLLGNCDEDTACDHVIYFSQGWSMATRAQSEDRAHRRGTKRPVQVTDLCVVDAIDFDIRKRVMSKRLTALAVQDVKEILNNVFKKEART